MHLAAGRRVTLVEDEVDHGGDDAEPFGAVDGVGRLEFRPAWATARFARVMRCSIAASLTRKARAISFTDRPETMRSAREICCVAGRSGWQQMNSSRSTSSR